ncbi:MAG: hypothetical protein JW889_03040 [Verrucomicrobia bacterium]|nr:hypothetical protein [Verrucomicrobiota bacterium]
MPLADDELIAIGIRHMDALLLAEDYTKARAIGQYLIASYPGDPDVLKTAGYAAFLDEKGGNGVLKTIEFFSEAHRLRPHDLELWFWSAYTRVLWGDCAALDKGETARLMEELAFHGAQSRYVAYACAHHPTCYGDRSLGKRLLEHGLAILPNLMALWDLKISLAESAEEQEELFRQAKAIEPFHDYCDMRAMDEYVAEIVSKDALFNRSASYDHYVSRGGL